MAENNQIFVKIYGQNEYLRLLNALKTKQFHWKSGQPAMEPPVFLREMTDAEGNDVVGIRGLLLNKKTIGYFPIEVFDNQEKSHLLNACVNVDDAIKMITEN